MSSTQRLDTTKREAQRRKNRAGSRGARRGVILVLALCGLLSAQPAVHAGIAAGGRPLSLGDGTNSRLNQQRIAPLLQQLQRPVDRRNPWGQRSGLGLGSAAAARAKLAEIRARVQKAIDLAKKRMSPACGRWLQQQFNRGNVCISWGMGAFGAMRPDGSTRKLATERIALNPCELLRDPLRGGVVDCLGAGLINTAETLVHETLHAAQSWVGTGATSSEARVAAARQADCNEIEAHLMNAEWARAFREALCDRNLVDPRVALPATGLDAEIRCLLQELRDRRTAAERAVIIPALKTRLQQVEGSDRRMAQRYRARKNAWTRYLRSGDLPRLIRDLNAIAASAVRRGGRLEAFEAEGNVIVVRGGSETEEVIGTRFETIEDLAVLEGEDGVVLLAAGTEAGQVSVVAYRSAGQGPFVATEETLLVRPDARLGAGVQLVPEPDPQDLEQPRLLMLGENRLFGVDYDAVDGEAGATVVPVSEPFAFLPIATAYLFDVGVGHGEVFGISGDEMFRTALPGVSLPVFRDLDGDGYFETFGEETHEERTTFPPTFAAAELVAGIGSVAGYGVRGVPLEALGVDEGTGAVRPLGPSVAGRGLDEAVELILDEPLRAGEVVLLVDGESGRVSEDLRVSEEPGGEPAFRRGDANGDGRVDISDAVALLGCLFRGDPCGTCEDASDVNDDGGLDIADPVTALDAIFRGGAQPPSPGTSNCGEDPTEDGLGCEDDASCAAS